MSDIKKTLNSLISDTEQLRDELSLKIQLGKQEAKDQFQQLEPSYQRFRSTSARIASVAGDTAAELRVASELGIEAHNSEELESALELAASEVKDGFNRVRHLL